MDAIDEVEHFDPFAHELTGLAKKYAHGDCHVLASVLSSITGWPIRAALVDDIWTGRACLVHAWVRSPDGSALDAHGVSDPDHLLEQYPDGDRAYVCEMSPDEVMRIGSGRKTLSNARREKAEIFARELMENHGIQSEPETPREVMRS